MKISFIFGSFIGFFLVQFFRVGFPDGFTNSQTMISNRQTAALMKQFLGVI